MSRIRGVFLAAIPVMLLDENVIIELLTSQPTPEQALDIHPSLELQARVSELLDRNKADMKLQVTRRQFLKICGGALAALHLSSSLKALATVRASEKLLFHASFDLGADADHALGSGVSESAGVRFWRVLNAGGQAMVAYPGSVLRYASTGNVLPQRGTVELGIKPLLGFNLDNEHRFMVITDASTSSAIYVEAAAASSPNLRVRFQGDSDEYTAVTSSAVREWMIGEWHHIAVTWDDSVGQLVLYVDGVAAGNVELSVVPSSLEGSLLIGGDEAAASSPATSAFSEIDNVYIYDYARSATEIQVDYAQFRADLRASDRANWSPGVPSLVSLEMVPKPEFVFAVMTDTHIGEPGAETKYIHHWRVNETIGQINALRPEFVVNCGDMTAYWPNHARKVPAAQETLRLHANFDMPVYYVPGNHDIGNKQSMSNKGNLITEEAITAYREYFGPDYYSFDFRDCHFIVLNAQIFNSDLPAASEQWRWLLTDLETAKNSRLTFMFLHIPLFVVDQDDPGPGNYEVIDEPARSGLMQLVNTYHIDAVFTGHTHHPISNRVEDAELLTVPSTTFARPFGKNYGVSFYATIYDEWKVGYEIVRVYSDGFVVNHVASFPHAYPVPEIQVDNSSPQKRFLNRKAKETEDNLFGLVSAPVPEIQHISRPTVDDQAWHLPSQVGAKWVRISPSAFDWSAIETQRGSYRIDPAQDRALSIGMPAGVNLVMPLTTHNSLYSQDERREAFSSFVQFLAQRFAHCITTWEIVYNGQPAAEFVDLVDEARQQLVGTTASPQTIAGPFSTPDQTIIPEIADKVDAVVVDVLLSSDGDGDVRAQLQEWHCIVEQLSDPIELWAQVALTDANNLCVQIMAKRLARAFIVFQELGVRFFWNHMLGTPEGLLDRMFDPTELYYTVQLLTTLFDSSVLPWMDLDVEIKNAGSSIEVSTFAGRDRAYIVCWQTRNPGYDGVAEVVDLIVNDRNYAKLTAIDTLSCVGQELNWSKEAGKIRIPDLFVRDYPTIVVLWSADYISIFLPLITKDSFSKSQ